MTTTSELKPLLKRLKLGYLLKHTARTACSSPQRPVGLCLFSTNNPQLEVTRRNNRNLEMHLQKAGFEEVCRLEDFDWTAEITVDRRLVDAVFSLDFINRHEHVLFVGPVGVGKSFLAQALGYAAVRAGYSVRFIRADAFFRTLAQSRVDHTLEKTFRSFLSPDLLIMDDFGLQKLTAQQSTDLYELIIARHRQSSFVITSNRTVEEWLGLFDDPILGNSALDRLANASYQIIIEGTSYRERLSPHRRKPRLVIRTSHSGGCTASSAAPEASRSGRTACG